MTSDATGVLRTLTPEQHNARVAKIRLANDSVFKNVDGWVGERIWFVVDFIQRYHDQRGVNGDIAEIGVHHGKLFFLIASIAREGETCIAIDIFENQHLNLDQSGSGSRAVFEQHVENLFPSLRERLRIVQADSLSITPVTARRVISEAGIRVFSVDGGHTIAHAVNDLGLAQELLVPSGLVMLDDFFGPHWPSVTEGFFRYMATANRRLAPFLIYQNKLFLTTIAEQEPMQDEIRKYMEEKDGAAIHTRWRYSSLLGFKVLCFS